MLQECMRTCGIKRGLKRLTAKIVDAISTIAFGAFRARRPSCGVGLHAHVATAVCERCGGKAYGVWLRNTQQHSPWSVVADNQQGTLTFLNFLLQVHDLFAAVRTTAKLVGLRPHQLQQARN